MRCQKRRKKAKRRALLLLLLLLAAAAAVAAFRIRAIFMEYAANVCEDSALQEINNLMEEEVFSHPESYENMIILEHDSQNHVTALRTDVLSIGRIKTKIVNGLFERLGDLEETTVEVPLGSVFAPNFFSGMGPSIDIGMAGLMQMEAEFISAFSAAGINQTRHNIIIEVHAGFRILTPLGGEDREIISRFPVTDTVIVGTVPERYTYIDELGNGFLGEIGDYDNSDEKGK